MNETPQIKDNTLTLDELRRGLANGMKMDQMPRFVTLPDGRKLDVAKRVDADLLKALIRGNRRQRRAAPKVKKKNG